MQFSIFVTVKVALELASNKTVAFPGAPLYLMYTSNSVSSDQILRAFVEVEYPTETFDGAYTVPVELLLLDDQLVNTVGFEVYV